MNDRDVALSKDQRTPVDHLCVICCQRTYENVGIQIDGSWYCFTCGTKKQRGELRSSNEQLIISGGIAYVESEHMGRSATVADCVRELERLRKENNTLHGVMGLWGLHPDPDDSTNAAKRAAVETPQPPSNQITAERSAEIADQLGKTSARHPAADQTKYWAWEGALHVRRQQAEIERLRAALLDAVKLIDEDVPREVKTRLCRIAGHDCEFTRLPSETCGDHFTSPHSEKLKCELQQGHTGDHKSGRWSWRLKPAEKATGERTDV